MGILTQDMVVHWTSSPLDSGVRAKVEIILVWVGNEVLNESAWQRVVVAVTLALLRTMFG